MNNINLNDKSLNLDMSSEKQEAMLLNAFVKQVELINWAVEDVLVDYIQASVRNSNILAEKKKARISNAFFACVILAMVGASALSCIFYERIYAATLWMAGILTACMITIAVISLMSIFDKLENKVERKRAAFEQEANLTLENYYQKKFERDSSCSSEGLFSEEDFKQEDHTNS